MVLVGAATEAGLAEDVWVATGLVMTGAMVVVTMAVGKVMLTLAPAAPASLKAAAKAMAWQVANAVSRMEEATAEDSVGRNQHNQSQADTHQ